MRFPILSRALTVVALVCPWSLAGQAARAPFGCYDFPAGRAIFSWHTYEPWSQTFAVYRSPLVEFTRTPGKRTGTFLMQAPGMRDTSAQSELAERFWERIAPDSIALTWSSGFSGTRMRLQVRGDTLDGTAIGFTDTWTEGQPAPVPLPVEGFRVPCPTAPRRAGAT